jgi:hypothetical protein
MLAPKTLPLKPSPSEAWQDQWDTLMENDQWLRRKLDRARRLREHYEYLNENCPDLASCLPGIVVDIGPGDGVLLEIARAHGHTGVGIDAPDGAGGMGNPYLQASKLMHQRQNLTVFYERFENWKPPEELLGKCVLANSRGSVEQVFSSYMKGKPHDQHHVAKELRWKQESDTEEALFRFVNKISELLREGGILLIHANGSATQESDQWYSETIIAQAAKCGLTLETSSHNLKHRFVKVNCDDSIEASESDSQSLSQEDRSPDQQSVE